MQCKALADRKAVRSCEARAAEAQKRLSNPIAFYRINDTRLLPASLTFSGLQLAQIRPLHIDLTRRHIVGPELTVRFEAEKAGPTRTVLQRPHASEPCEASQFPERWENTAREIACGLDLISLSDILLNNLCVQVKHASALGKLALPSASG